MSIIKRNNNHKSRREMLHAHKTVPLSSKLSEDKVITSRTQLFKAHLAAPTFFSDLIKSTPREKVRDDV